VWCVEEGSHLPAVLEWQRREVGYRGGGLLWERSCGIDLADAFGKSERQGPAAFATDHGDSQVSREKLFLVVLEALSTVPSQARPGRGRSEP